VGIGRRFEFALIDCRFILGNQLPRMSYLTTLDYFNFGSAVLVLLALPEVVMTANLAQSGKTARAYRIQKAARVVFPLLFASMVFTVFAV
jgi:hypothetical protein